MRSYCVIPTSIPSAIQRDVGYLFANSPTVHTLACKTT